MSTLRERVVDDDDEEEEWTLGVRRGTRSEIDVNGLAC
jgi:hypothetical protein